MDIYDKTADLAATIRDSEEYSDFIETSEKVEMSPAAREMLKEYRAKQFACELADMAGEDSESLRASLDDLCAEMEKDDLLRRYLSAEYNLYRMMEKIRDIFAEKLNLEPDTDDYVYDEENVCLN